MVGVGLLWGWRVFSVLRVIISGVMVIGWFGFFAGSKIIFKENVIVIGSLGRVDIFADVSKWS